MAEVVVGMETAAGVCAKAGSEPEKRRKRPKRRQLKDMLTTSWWLRLRSWAQPGNHISSRGGCCYVSLYGTEGKTEKFRWAR